MRKTYLPLLIMAISLVFGSCKKESFDERMQREVKDFTEKQCPKEMDPYTVMDSMTYDMVSKTLTYNYTVNGDLDVDSLYDTEFDDLFSKKLFDNVKSSIQLKPYKEKGVSFRYVYCSRKSGKVLLDYTFTKEDYQ